MDQLILDALVVVQVINDLIETSASGSSTNMLEFCSDGYNCRIQFLDNDLWNSIEDLREFIDDDNCYEVLLDYVTREYNKVIDNLQLQKLK